MPNERNGQLVVPKEYVGEFDAVGVVPISEGEGIQLANLVTPILEHLGPWRAMGEHMESPVSGVKLETEDVMRRYEQHIPQELDSRYNAVDGLSSRAAAVTLAATELGEDSAGNGYVATSHPLIAIKADLSALRRESYDPYILSATLAHEYAHVRDIQTAPLLYQTAIGNTASELVGYKISDVLYRRTAQSAVPKEYAASIESWRQQNISLDTPFTPTEDQAKHLREVLGV